jgi:endonuclease/exonuclease/phosphatase family metal-dependent hydrolase
MVWNIIKKAIHDIEMNNDLRFGNESWERLKQMEKEILDWQYKLEREKENTGVYAALSDYQKRLLKNSTRIGFDILSHEEINLREARDLEKRGYIELVFNERHGRAYAAHITIFGRELLSLAKGAE